MYHLNVLHVFKLKTKFNLENALDKYLFRECNLASALSATLLQTCTFRYLNISRYSGISLLGPPGLINEAV